MMHAAGMLALLSITVPVQEADVLYREALFEEVDQGNLEKALELYGKVLSSGAADALKAKATLRRGHCYEKLGKKEEAEQAYREVAEKFASEVETAKQARARLAGLEMEKSAAPPSYQAQIEALILDLGSHQKEVRNNAIRRLTLIGETCVPQLKEAIAHKDLTLSLGAAQVLMNLEHYEGLYEVFIRAFTQKYQVKGGDDSSFFKLLQNREEDRKRFLSDVTRVSPAVLSSMAQLLAALEEPALQSHLEDRIVEEDAHGTIYSAWASRADESQFVRLMDRLLKPDKPQHEKAYQALQKVRQIKVELAGAEALDLVERVLKNLPAMRNAGFFPNWLHAPLQLAIQYLSPAAFIQGPYAHWLKQGEASDLPTLVYNVPLWTPWRMEFIDFFIDVLASPEYSAEVKKFILAGQQDWELKDESQKKKLVDAAYEALAGDLEMQIAALNAIQRNATDSEKLRLAKHLPGLKDQALRTAAAIYARAVFAEAGPERTPDLEEFKKLHVGGSAEFRNGLLAGFAGIAHPVLDELFERSMASEDEAVRYHAIAHWWVRAKAVGPAFLIRALGDPSDKNKSRAIYALGQNAAFDAVPHLIPFLKSPKEKLRAAAEEALKAIKKHYEEQEVWIRWYDEMKDKLKK
ncbi:MAG: HEAT repeat domain-containing protein [Planctomycetes bacterium]|nr:HEAT repeat domain-containing protein [Planctomycetota bacterium]